MPKVVWKFQSPGYAPGHDLEVEMPSGAIIRHFGLQFGWPTFWAEVRPEMPREIRTFRIVGTGAEAPEATGWVYVGTSQCSSEPLVWHWYERVGD